MSRLKSLEPACIATRAFRLMESYRDTHGLPERRAMAAALGELAIEADELKKEQIDFAPPNRDERDWERGGFAGRAGWEGEIDG